MSIGELARPTGVSIRSLRYYETKQLFSSQREENGYRTYEQDERKRGETMASTLSDWAREFLREDRVGVLGTLNADGSSHLTTMWYLLADDGTLIITTLSRNQKVKNLRRDPRITFCVGDKTRSVSLSGHVTISEDQAVVRQDLERQVERYVKDEGIRAQVVATWLQQPHVALHFKPEKVTEFSVSLMH